MSGSPADDTVTGSTTPGATPTTPVPGVAANIGGPTVESPGNLPGQAAQTTGSGAVTPTAPLVDKFQATILPPAAEVVAAAPSSKPIPAGMVRVVYRGDAHVVDLKGPDGKGESPYSFRPGEPVDVPSEVAEELLTWPGQTFEVVKE